MGNCQNIPDDNLKELEICSPSVYSDILKKEEASGCSLVIKGRISAKESPGIFDYEDNELFNEEKFQIRKNTRIILAEQDDQKVLEVAEDKKGDPGENEIVIFRLQKNKVCIIPNRTNFNKGGFWVRVLQDDDKYCIKNGDMIKLGRIILKIRKMKPAKTNDKEICELEIAKKDYKKPEILSKNDNEETVCRICYSHEATEEDPLINLCKCKGSVSYYHYECLKKWLSFKSIEKTNDLYSLISLKKFKCNMCKSDFPLDLIMNGKGASLLDLALPDTNYIFMEMYCKEKDNRRYTLKNLYVLNLNVMQSIILGRGRNCHIRINDISVSRVHSTISFVDGKFFIQDNKSKFGTLVAVNQPFMLPVGDSLELQIMQTHLKLEYVKINSSGWGCCGPRNISDLEALDEANNFNINSDTEAPKREYIEH